MAKLTNKNKSGIIRSLMDKERVKLEAIKDEIAMKWYYYTMEHIPEDVKKIFDDPNKRKYLKLDSSYYLGSYFKDEYLSVTIKFPHLMISPSILPSIMDCDFFAEIAERYLAEQKRVSSLESKLRCALSHIPTVKRLKDEFPEAYEMYLKCTGDESEEKSLSGCDDIENVRAQLSSNRKTI